MARPFALVHVSGSLPLQLPEKTRQLGLDEAITGEERGALAPEEVAPPTLRPPQQAGAPRDRGGERLVDDEAVAGDAERRLEELRERSRPVPFHQLLQATHRPGRRVGGAERRFRAGP